MLRRAWLFIRGIPGTIARSTWNALTWLASTPFTDSSGRQHRRTILGSVKSGISGVFGRGDPNRSKYDDFLSSARQRDMGNDVSLTYSRTGQLVMCLAGHVLTDGTLDKFKALQDGGEEGIDPQSAGLRRRGFFSFYSSAGYGHSGADESKVKKLRGFAKLLKDVGGSIDVETTGTGNRVLVFRLPPNCTPEDAENILNNFFRLLNIDNKEAAKSIAKDLTQRSEDEERGHVSHSPIPAPDTPSREGGAEVVTAAQVHTPPEGPFPPQPKEISLQ